MDEVQEKTQELFEDLKRFLQSAQTDYDEKRYGNCDFYLSQFNKFLKRSKEIGLGFEIESVSEADRDLVEHHSHTVGEPYNPHTYASPQSNSRKLRELITYAEKLQSKLIKKSENLNSHNKLNGEDNFWDLIHPSIVGNSKARFDAGHYADAVETAVKYVNNFVKAKVKKKTGNELDGASLMNTAFSPKNPIISLDDLSTSTGQNVQLGYMQIFAGTIIGIRNPKAHDIISIDKPRAIHLIFLASLLMYKLDEAV